MSKGKLAIWGTCGGAPMGESVVVSGPVRIRAWLSCARPLRRVCLLRDGAPLQWEDLEGTSATVDLVDPDATPGPHWYSVTAEARSPFFAQSVLAHTSPLFVSVNQQG